MIPVSSSAFSMELGGSACHARDSTGVHHAAVNYTEALPA